MYKDEIELMRNKCMNAFSFDIKDVKELFAFALQHAKERPQLKPVDLSVLIQSGIDVEGSEGDRWYLYDHAVKSPKGETHYTLVDSCDRETVWEQCRPRMNHIHAWQGGRCPLPKGLSVKVVLRGGSALRGAAPTHRWVWAHASNIRAGYARASADIIAFEVLGLADGYCWPWEETCPQGK